MLGRDCGRTRRVPTLGFLILGGDYPVLVDTGYRSNQIMETLGMRGLQYQNMIENSARQTWAAAWRHPLCRAHASAHRPRRQGRPVPDEYDRCRQSQGARIFRLGPHAPAISGAGHQASDRPAAHKGALRFLDLEVTGPVELIPGVYCEAAGAHTEGSINVHVHTAEGVATICGDVIYDINDQIIEPFRQIHDGEPQTDRQPRGFETG